MNYRRKEKKIPGTVFKVTSNPVFLTRHSPVRKYILISWEKHGKRLLDAIMN